MQPANIDQLRDELVHYRSELENVDLRASLIEAAFPRLRATLELFPDSLLKGDVLELGASPYFMSHWLHRLCKGTLKLANYFGTSGTSGRQRLVHDKTGEEICLDFDLFNIETDEFPYPDGSFDLVLFCELIEHLALNPVWVLSQIHRVLRPGGSVIITTPNALSLERLETYLCGGTQAVDRFAPALGYGARHNHEYHPRELRELLEGTGFTIDEMVVHELERFSWKKRCERALWKHFLRRYSADPRETHIFLRARRGERFRWHFPPSLFDHIEFYLLVRDPFVEMGINDEIQCTHGWSPLEDWGTWGGCVRWVEGQGKAYLRAVNGASRVRIELSAKAGTVPASVAAHVAVRNRAGDKYADIVRQVARGGWQIVEIPLEHQPNSGDEIEVSIDIDPADLQDPALANLSGWERGAAVRRISLRAE
jgi:SAM-dependent methyltransferase